MDAALKLEGVTKRYGDFTAVNDLSFAARRGKILGFLGPNGAGKTSTIRMVLGLVEPTAGSIDVLGASDARAVRERVGFLPEERGLYRRMTPIDAIAFFGGLKGVPQGEARRRAAVMLEAQGLGHAAKRQIRHLSKGMAQKVQLLSAIVHEPELVILDEPFSGLDPVNQQALEQVIRDLATRGATVVFSTHVMQHAERLCDHVVCWPRVARCSTAASPRPAATRPGRWCWKGPWTRPRSPACPGSRPWPSRIPRTATAASPPPLARAPPARMRSRPPSRAGWTSFASNCGSRPCTTPSSP